MALLAGGDVLTLLFFLDAYFLGGFGEDGRGMKGLSKGVIATAKSWALGIPISVMGFLCVEAMTNRP
ncbi:hypothetical protein RJT34_15380 [Clitoria ternatea]|uniref:Uncharacterized protein n=1 Tax=Clitoria ternatea TaxID=43366 RepID=A0AAN9J683_CLITE